MVNVIRDRITINGSVTESAAATFTQTTEDLSDFVDLYDNQVLIVDKIQVELPRIDETPGNEATEYTSMQFTHTTQNAMQAWTNEDLIQPVKYEITGMGAAASVYTQNTDERLPTITFDREEDKPILYHKTLYISALGTNDAAQTYYYKISCRQIKITDDTAKALLADLSEEL